MHKKQEKISWVIANLTRQHNSVKMFNFRSKLILRRKILCTKWFNSDFFVFFFGNKIVNSGAKMEFK